MRARKKLKKSVLKRNKRKIIAGLVLVALATVFIFYKLAMQTECEKTQVPSQISIKIYSPQNKTYNITNIPISVMASQDVLWINNSFDKGPSITECLNCKWYTRYDLNFKPGVHTVDVYVSDYENNVITAGVTFTVENG